MWGSFIPIIMIQFFAASMAELCSSMPTAVSTLKLWWLIEGRIVLCFGSASTARMGSFGFGSLPKTESHLYQWVTGWSNVFGQITGPASVDYGRFLGS